MKISASVLKIVEKIQRTREKLEKSSFYAKVTRQLQARKMGALIEKVIGTDPYHSQLQLVLYGVGKLDFNMDDLDEDEEHVEGNRTQLCLAILLRENFQWVDDIVVYDPVLSAAEQKALKAFDCTYLSVNENGRRTVDRPTLFFMPHCDAFLFGNVLKANWTLANLNKIIILGNSFKDFQAYEKYYPYYIDANKMKEILDTDHMLHEIRLAGVGPQNSTAFTDLSWAFNDLSWHFFDWDGSLHCFTSDDRDNKIDW